MKKSPSVTPLLLGAGAVGVLALGVWAARRQKAEPAPPSGKVPSEKTPWSIVPPPPDAVWLQPTPEPSSGGAPAGGAPTAGSPSGGAPTTGSPSGGAPVASGGAPGWQVSAPAGGVAYLDAVAFLDERFARAEDKPTSAQLARITALFTELGVQADGKIYSRPSIEAANKGFDLATAFDMERAPAAVGRAVRDFTKAAYQNLPLPLARTA